MSAADEPGTTDENRVRGLYPKYRVFRVVDGVGAALGDELTEPVFVLRPETDPMARAALRRYQILARMRGYHELADDLGDWLARLRQTGMTEEQGEVTRADIEAEAEETLTKLLWGSEAKIRHHVADPEIEGYDGFGAPIARQETMALSNEVLSDARRALAALRLMVPQNVHRDVTARIEAAFSALGRAAEPPSQFADPAVDPRAANPPTAGSTKIEPGEERACETCLETIAWDADENRWHHVDTVPGLASPFHEGKPMKPMPE